jgi:hypothetical protein
MRFSCRLGRPMGPAVEETRESRFGASAKLGGNDPVVSPVERIGSNQESARIKLKLDYAAARESGQAPDRTR